MMRFQFAKFGATEDKTKVDDWDHEHEHEHEHEHDVT
jgi:hypothetical protein